jgi:hypothetical protein
MVAVIIMNMEEVLKKINGGASVLKVAVIESYPVIPNQSVKKMISDSCASFNAFHYFHAY